MKKRTLAFIPLLALPVIIGAWLVISWRQTPAWKTTLNGYITFLRETGQASYQVVSSTRAASPASFTTAMSAETYTDSPVFQSNHGPNASYSAALESLPYPPEEVVCVLLKGAGQQQLVYVALHNSLYNADWIVHVAPEPWGSPILQSHLASLGCGMDT